MQNYSLIKKFAADILYGSNKDLHLIPTFQRKIPFYYSSIPQS